MKESYPIPHTAKLALKMLEREHAQRVADLGSLVVLDMGKNPGDDWRVDFTTGLVTRDVPDAPAEGTP